MLEKSGIVMDLELQRLLLRLATGSCIMLEFADAREEDLVQGSEVQFTINSDNYSRICKKKPPVRTTSTRWLH